MKRTNRRNSRRGHALITMGLFIIPLLAFFALSVDLGLLAVARTQVQNATDVAALAGVRTLNGNTANGANNNYSNVTPAAQHAATANPILGNTLQSSQVAVSIGRYVYDSSAQQFEGQIPGPSGDNWSLVQATTNFNVGDNLPFSKLLGLGAGSLQTTATAVHRPRDIAVVLDFSGSMRFGSFLAYAGGLSNFLQQANAVNNEDTDVPSFGHYSAFGSGSMYAASYNNPFLPANTTATTSDGRPPMCADFYQDAIGTPAFAPASASYATKPGGDNYLTTSKNTSNSYAQTLAQMLGSSSYDNTFEKNGYKGYTGVTFNGYTVGPGYYGKTFFIWPPDPTNDWRKLYFYQDGTTNPLNDNTKLWTNSGVWQAPGNNYDINYTAILNFIQNVGPNPFPSTMRSGRIVYYTSIPTSISLPPANTDQQFWKDYIDYVLGLTDVGQPPTGQNYQIINNGQNSNTGYGSDVTWGTIHISSPPSSGNPKPYMTYSDNPQRPLLNFWFGPLTMVDFLDNYKLFPDVSNYSNNRYCWWPGTCHESPMYECKLGIQAALNDIQNNHPNDWVSLMFFSTPQSSANDNTGRFNGARVGLGQNYSNMSDSLWYPPATVGNPSATVTPYDSNNLQVPRAYGGTCYAQPLMLAYNQFSASSACANYANTAGLVGGNGRKGAQKIVIFETDGAPNTTASGNLQNNGAYQSYYKIRYNPNSPNGSEYPNSVNGYSDNASAVTNQIYNICSQIVAADTASPPGYTSGARKVLIHCLGFGPLFAPGTSTAAPNTATLNQMQIIGNVNDGMPSYKIIYGNQTTIINNLQTAFTNILESTVPVSLIQ